MSLTTRRLLARGLGYDKIDIFDDPKFASTVSDLFRDLRAVQQEETDQRLSNYVKLQTQRAEGGHALGRFAETSDAAMFSPDDEISDEAKEVAASMFDYLRDLMDISDDLSFTDKLAFDRELEGMLRELERLGTRVYVAGRPVKMSGAGWPDKTPIPIQIGYLTVVPARKELTEVLVPRLPQLS